MSEFDNSTITGFIDAGTVAPESAPQSAVPIITQIRLKFGRTPGSPGISVPTTPITVFVGPNNSGKSRILSELFQYCQSGLKNTGALIFDELTFSGFSEADIDLSIERVKQKPNQNESVPAGNVIVGNARLGRSTLPLVDLTEHMRRPQSNHPAFCQWYLKLATLMLDGASRIQLVNNQHAGDLQEPPQTSFQLLFRDDTKRREVRRIVSEAFGSYFVLDPTNLGQLRVRLSERPPKNDLEERGLHADAVAFHAAAVDIAQSSDGVKAFTGILTEVMAGDPHVLLIDEPEAFLHPSLASKLGYELSKAALSTHKNIFVSTHSSSFVMGCIQSGAPVNIIRLTYRAGVATARVLPSDEILELMRHPLLRSTGILNGLFYEFVVVTESDTDRAFYQEVNERLLQLKPEWGIKNCLFINAQNKQTVQTILRPLRKLGIPSAGIVDIDVIKEGGTTWTNLLDGAAVPEISRQAMAATRAAIKKAMDASGKDMKRDGGLNILQGENREAADNLIKQLTDYGIFVVPGGELESWLKRLEIGGHGPGWLIKMFEKMGTNPDTKDYVRPEEDDVWEFMSILKCWLENPNRRGIPA
ncbi:ATP-dependent nuclease [Burkholderia ambifaria]|uniref:ATP-dependent nuclease n=1 Tax=Burkholderia ambifaria TaxID=152480 RepID=UPI001ABAD815|nr:AAA family ATPase [Burkholderia ambifaria]